MITRNGLVLTCDPGDWANTPTSITYRWLLNGTAVPGATSQTWTPPASAWGSLFGCEVVGVNAAGQSLPALAQEVYIGILDAFDAKTLTLASLHKLMAAQTGARVRRTNGDPLAQDTVIPFTASGAFDETALLNYAGGQNLIARSEEFTNISIWGRNPVSLLVEQDGLINGSPAWRITTAAESGFQSIHQGYSGWTGGVRYTWSVDVDRGNARFVQYFFNNGISCLANELTVDDKLGKVTVKGLQVINGAQTVKSLVLNQLQCLYVPSSEYTSR
jgi:hypothetical protein